MAEFRIVRRPVPNRMMQPAALTAASQLVTDPATALRTPVSGMAGFGARADWQGEAWDMVDLVGELRYYISWRASAASRVLLLASELDPDTGLPTGGTEDTRVTGLVRAIAGGPLGQAQLVKRAVQCLTVPGEVWIAVLIRDDSPPEGTWLALSREEISTSGSSVFVEMPTGVKHELRLTSGRGRPGDSIFRVWNPKPRRASEPDSMVRASLDSLREIVRTTKMIDNASKSRLIGNGIVFVPAEMSLPSMQAPVAALSGEGPTSESVEPEQLPVHQQLQNLLFQVAQVAYNDEDSMAALIPIIATVAGEHISKVSHLKFDNSVTDTNIKLRNEAVARLALGLDVSPERLLGLGSTSNHWNAWLTSDDDVRLHIEPPIETICSALTECVLRPVLARNGLDPNKFVVWYDASRLTADPDKTDEATAAFDRGVINAEAYRDFLGLGADSGYDFTTLEGWQAWATDKVSRDPAYLRALLPLVPTLDGAITIDDIPDPAPEPPPAASPDSGESEPDTENAAAAGRVDVLGERSKQLAARRRGSEQN